MFEEEEISLASENGLKLLRELKERKGKERESDHSFCVLCGVMCVKEESVTSCSSAKNY